MASHRVLYLNRATDDVYEIIRSQLPPGFELLCLARDDDDERLRLLPDAEFILVATARLTESMMKAAPRLKLIQHQGVGFDTTDVAAARRLGIPVGLTPEGTTINVAEHTLLLILAVYRRLVVAQNSLARGEFLQFALRPTSYELAGKTVGLVGMGRIGREVARRVRAFDARVLYSDPAVTLPPADERDFAASKVGFEPLLAASDVVSLHLPLTAATRHLIAGKTLAAMKPTAILINTARGALVDEAALVQALRERRLAGAGLDVFEKEPPGADNPLLALDNVILTPHIAAGTRDALVEKMRAAFANMERVLRGERPANLVP